MRRRGGGRRRGGRHAVRYFESWETQTPPHPTMAHHLIREEIRSVRAVLLRQDACTPNKRHGRRRYSRQVPQQIYEWLNACEACTRMAASVRMPAPAPSTFLSSKTLSYESNQTLQKKRRCNKLSTTFSRDTEPLPSCQQRGNGLEILEGAGNPTVKLFASMLHQTRSGSSELSSGQ
jgi:hypothetical protein